MTILPAASSTSSASFAAPERFIATVERLRLLLWHRMRAPWALQMALLNRIGRIGKRFAVLVALFRAGTLRPARVRPSRARDPQEPPAPADRPRPPDPVPRRAGWLGELLGAEAPSLRGWVLGAVHDAEMQAMIAADPRFGRMLRSMLRLLMAGPLPESLRPPQRARRARAAVGGDGAAAAAASVPEAEDRRRAVAAASGRGWSARAEHDGRRRSARWPRARSLTGLPDPRRILPT